MSKKKTPYIAVPNGRLWLATPRRNCCGPDSFLICKSCREEQTKGPSKAIVIECERWVDARHVARMLFGAAEVSVVSVPMTKNLPTRYQVRWEGSAARRVPDLRLRIRKARRNGNNEAWRDLR